MSSILYYSNHCDNCKTLLQKLSRSDVKKDIHFVCLDKRVKKSNNLFVVLSNGQQVLLPPSITKVPALLQLNHGHNVIFGEEIDNYLGPKQETNTSQRTQIENGGEPQAFAMNQSGFGVASDEFSYLDQDSGEMSAKGSGGMRQPHHYASCDYSSSIETPPDTYSADTIGEISMDQLQQKRNKDIQI